MHLPAVNDGAPEITHMVNENNCEHFLPLLNNEWLASGHIIMVNDGSPMVK